jgi:hypothetical protein
VHGDEYVDDRLERGGFQMCSKVDEKIAVPRVIRGDVKEMFVEEVGIDGGMGGIKGKCRDEFGEDKGFLSLGC